MTKHCFIVTSAINTKWGVYSNEIRLHQTRQTLESIKEYAPNSKIIVMESSAIPLTEWQMHVVENNSDLVIDCSADPHVLYCNEVATDQSVLKNYTEMHCFRKTLEECLAHNDFAGIDRVHKISGRYMLNGEFNMNLYNNNPNIVIGPVHESNLVSVNRQLEKQYMCRLWSWPIAMTRDIIKVYANSLDEFLDRMKPDPSDVPGIDGKPRQAGRYIDLEHLLYKFLNPKHVQNVDRIGITGDISKTGETVAD